MASALWITFWVFFALFWLAGVPIVFVISFSVFAILMRQGGNEMPQQHWIAFWLSFLGMYSSLFTRVDAAVATSWWIIGAVVRFFLPSDYTMSASVFWILAALLVPTALPAAVVMEAPRSSSSSAKPKCTLGMIVSSMLWMFNFYFTFEGIHLPGLLISWWWVMALVGITLVAVNIFSNPGYLGASFMYFVGVAILHNQMWPWNRDFGWLWIGAWFLLFQSAAFAFAPDMPVLWYMVMMGMIVGLGYGFRPDLSLLRFVLWAGTILVSRMFLFFIYIFYIHAGPMDDMFPFNLFSHTWKMSTPPWFPLSSRRLDSLNDTALCDRCDEFTRNSELIVGSSAYLTRLIEWHDFWNKADFCSQFNKPADGAGLSGSSSTLVEPSCRLCCLLWCSISARRRRVLCGDNSTTDGPPLANSVLSQPQDSDAKLRVKVWEQRPLSLYTYLQLFWGDVPIGTRLLVHRDNLFATPSPTVRDARTDSLEHFEQARKWLEMCKAAHELCRGVGNSKPELPARMLFVSGGEGWKPGQPPEALKVIETSDIEAPVEYLALSHCWGPVTEMRFKLLASNIDVCFGKIDFAGLSRNMQDAITVTLALGFSYVWIDSLCIIQKDHTGQENGDVANIWRADWETEAKKMGGVYSGAACTIASTASSTSSGGCFHPRSPRGLQPCKIGASSPDGLSPAWIYARRDDVAEFERGVNRAPLNTRGWVMQERLLSRRILHFGADMLFWECCGRAASELNPGGYVYKRFPDDFRDNYMPNLRGYIATRGDALRAGREGRGLKWAAREKVRRRPPQEFVDPDAPPAGQAVWQQNRGFWKNVLKSAAEEPWDADDKGGGSDGVARAGFRGAFERLRGSAGVADFADGGGGSEQAVGRYSFSQLWYDVVEAYSRGRLTASTDKLMALKGIEDEVARATRLTYLRGLWREKLATDLLWFAIDGPGRRLLRDEQQGEAAVPVAPTWSWASVDAAVALDLLPENSRVEAEVTETLVEVVEACADRDNPADMVITLRGPLLPIPSPTSDKGTWSVDVGERGAASARVFPDVINPDICQMSDLYCLSFLVLNRRKEKSLIPSSSEDVQGLVLRLVSRDEAEDRPDVYERVGYLTTSYIEQSQAATRARKELKKAEVKTLRLAGWSPDQPRLPGDGDSLLQRNEQPTP